MCLSVIVCKSSHKFKVLTSRTSSDAWCIFDRCIYLEILMCIFGRCIYLEILMCILIGVFLIGIFLLILFEMLFVLQSEVKPIERNGVVPENRRILRNVL